MNRTRIACLSLLLLLVAACGTKPTSSPHASGSTQASPSASATIQTSLSWKPCSGHATLQCSTLQVPLNYAKPNGTQISLALIRETASEPAQSLGSIVVNPGGPGGSGLEFMEEGGFPWGALAQRYNIVSFDPRGVGSSTPAVHCLDTAAMSQYIAANPMPTTAAEVADEVTESKEFAQGCESMSAAILPYVSTENAARDMDRIRIALGESTLNYLGFSYGTYLGSVYATLFPHNVGHMALDGDIDPTLTEAQMGEDQAEGFEANLDAMLAQCAEQTTCPIYNHGDPTAELNSVMAHIESTPIPAGSSTLNYGEAFLGILAGLYDPADWIYDEDALADADSGNGAVMLELSDSYADVQPNGSYSNELDANTAINCDDGPTPPSLAQMGTLATQFNAVAPHFGISSAYGPLTCLYWPFPPTGRVTVSAPTAPPILLVGGTHDPATPYVWAQALHQQLSTSVLVTRDGYGHVSFDKSSCVRQIMDNFFIGGTLPAANTVCQTDPGA